MLSVLLMILKVLGIIILILLGTILTFALLVLFVPVRYRIMVHRKTQEEIPISVKIKATWFWHVINAVFSYPEAAFLRVRLFCFTLFRSDKANAATESSEDKEKKKKVSEAELPASKPLVQEQEHEKEAVSQAENESETVGEKQFGADNRKHKKNHAPKKKGLLSKFVEFFRKLWSVIKNIKYTILKICDKIKHIVKNIQYYVKIIQSDTFQRAWAVCSRQVFSLLKSISPRKIRGSVLIGTGDPASTGQILAVYGMLYPLLGNHIDIVPDFEQQIIEGDLYVKGKITVFKALKTAWIVYFNKDLRRLIKLLKREAA